MHVAVYTGCTGFTGSIAGAGASVQGDWRIGIESIQAHLEPNGVESIRMHSLGCGKARESFHVLFCVDFDSWLASRLRRHSEMEHFSRRSQQISASEEFLSLLVIGWAQGVHKRTAALKCLRDEQNCYNCYKTRMPWRRSMLYERF